MRQPEDEQAERSAQAAPGERSAQAEPIERSAQAGQSGQGEPPERSGQAAPDGRDGRASRMSAPKKTFAALWAATLIVFTYKTVLDTTAPAFALGVGLSLPEAGLQTSAFFVVSIIARFVFGPIADAAGKHRMMLAGQVMLAAGALILSCSSKLATIVIGRCVQACGIAAFYPSAIAFATVLAPPNRRGTYLGVFRLAVALPMMFGPAAFLEGAARFGWPVCFVALALLIAASLAIMRTGCPSGPKDERPQPAAQRAPLSYLVKSYAQVFTESRPTYLLTLALAFASSMGFSAISGFAAVLLDRGFAQAASGTFFFFFGIGGLLGGPLAGAAADRAGTARGLAGSFAAESLGLALFAFGSQTPIAVCLAGALVGLGKSGAAVTIADLVARDVPERHRTLAMAIQQSCGDLGSACVMGFAGAALDSWGFSPLPALGLGALTLLLGLISLVAMRDEADT